MRPSATTGHLCGLRLCIFSLVASYSHVSSVCMIFCPSADERLGANWSEVEAVLNGKCPGRVLMSGLQLNTVQESAGVLLAFFLCRYEQLMDLCLLEKARTGLAELIICSEGCARPPRGHVGFGRRPDSGPRVASSAFHFQASFASSFLL